MFINESTNVKDSAIFYAFMREALIEQVDGDEEMVSFIESASDTDVISYAVTGKAAPSDLDTTLYETALMSIIKESVLENPEIFVESEDYSLKDFVSEIGTMSGISSMDILREEDTGKSWGNSSKDNSTRKGIRGQLSTKNSGTKAAGADRGNSTPNSRSGEFSGVTSSGSNTGNETNKAQSARASEFVDAQKDMDRRRDHTSGGNDSAVAWGDSDADNSTRKGDSGYFANFFQKAKNTWSNVTSSKAWSDVSGFLSKHQKKIGVAALVAAASFIAYKAYKNYFSKAAKACAGKSGAEKQACMAKVRQQANKAKIAALRKGSSMAKNSSNPSKARAAINAKIAKARK